MQVREERPKAFSEAAPQHEKRAGVSAGAWARPLLVPVATFFFSRLVVLAAAGMATWLARPLHVTQVLSGWDGGWYLRIAASGYPASVASEGGGNRWAFFPGLPGVIRVVSRVTGLSFEHAGVVVAFVFGLTAVIAVWLAVRQVFGNAVADRTAVVLCFFPTAYTLSMVYTEGLFVTTAALCLWLLGAQRWALAGLAASAASLTRSVGAALVVACVVIALQAAWKHRSPRPLSAVVLAPLGFLAWTLYQLHRTGSPVAFLKAQAAWDHHFVWLTTPFTAFWNVVSDRAAWRDANNVMGAAALVIVAVTVALMVWHHLRRHPIPLAWWIYTVLATLAAFSPFWASSIPRYVMAVFPLLVMIAVAVPRRFEGALVGSMALLQGSLATIAFASILTWQTAPFAP